MEDRQKVSQTALTDYAVKRQEALNNKPKAEFVPIEYKGNFQTDDTPYDPLDYKEVRQRILNNVETAINARFPLQSDRYILTVDDIHYQNHNYTKKHEKDALLNGTSLDARLRGTWNLYDKTTGKLIDSKTATLLNVPYMTSKGTFIRNGSEFALKNMFRLRSGVYTRIKNDGNIATHINPEQGTGRRSTINMDAETGIFTIKLGTRNYGVLPLLKAIGAAPDEIEKAWGKELFETNYNKYKNIMTGADTKGANEYLTLWKEHYSKMKLDPETTGYTLGVPFKEVNENMFLRATAKILDIAKTYDASKTDPRDSLLFQKVMGPADYIPEKIVRDGGHLAQNLFNAIHRTGNLSVITPGVYQQHVDSVFLDDKHASYVDGASPFESIDLNASVSRIGEGGIGDLRAAPAESRHVQNSYLGFIDPIRCFSDKHQIMTADGFKVITEITHEDLIACMIDGCVVYRHPDAVHCYKYTDDLYSYCASNNTVRYEVTGNHRMWACNIPAKGKTKKRGGYQKPYNPKYEFIYAEDLHNKARKMKTAGHLPYNGNPETGCDFDYTSISMTLRTWLEFLGWYLSEGSTLIKNDKGQADTNKALSISQSACYNPENCELIETLLKSTTLNWSQGKNKKSYNIQHKDLAQYLRRFGYCQDKYIPQYVFDAPVEDREIFLNTLMRGDGRKPFGNEGYTYTTTSKQLAQGVERLAFDLGYCATVHCYHDKRQERYLDTYEVHLHISQECYLRKNGSKITEKSTKSNYYTRIPCNGYVYCVSVPGGMVYTKIYDYKPFWCGNSPESLKVGLDNFLSYGVKKDSNGNLYSMFIKNGEAKPRYIKMTEAAKSIVATPEYYDPSADPEEFIPVVSRGKDFEYVKRKEVDYFLASPNRMMSVGASTIPGIGGIRSNRTLMGCLHKDTLVMVYDRYTDDYVVYPVSTLYEICRAYIAAGGMLMPRLLGQLELVTIPTLDKLGSNYKVDLNIITTVGIKGIHQTNNDLSCYSVKIGDREVKVNGSHKWSVLEAGTTVPTTSLVPGMHIPVSLKPAIQEDIQWLPIDSITYLGEEDYFYDIDVYDNVYMLANGVFTHNSKYPLQALPLEKPEAPLVQRALTLDDGTETTTERYVAKALGAQFSPVDGKVTSITDDEIIIKGVDGQKYTIDLYNEYPSNQKGFLHNTPIVQVGQQVKANDLLAPSNYTTGDGVAALGVNLKTAFLNAPEGASFEDGIYISESAAKKLSSEQLYKTRISDDDDIEYDKTKFLNLFKTKDFTPEQLDILDDKGIVKVGTVLNYGDPMILGVQHRPAGLHGIANKATVPYVEKWEHHYPGTVTAVTAGSKRAAVYVKTYTPMKPGDKMCYDDKTEVCTDKGWKLFKDIEEDDKFLTLNITTGDTSFSYFARYYRWEHKGRLYAYESDKVSLRITENHNHLVAMSPAMTFVKLELIKNMKGKPFYHIIGTDFDNRDSFTRADEGHYKEGWVKYDGYVYCVEIPDTHTVYTRRRGKCVWSGNSNRMGAKSIVACYDSDTLVFTDKGFKPFPELTIQDRVAVLDTDSDPLSPTAHFELPSAVQHYPYEGQMYGYSDQNINWLVTPEHGMWCRKYHKRHKRHPENAYYARHEAKSIHGGRHQHIVTAAFPDTGYKQKFVVPKVPRPRPCRVNDINEFSIYDFAAFLGIYLAEGNTEINDHGRCGIVITQAENAEKYPASVERCRKIEALLDRMGLYWYKRGIKYRFTHHDLAHYLKQFGYAKDKYIPEEVFTDWPDEAKHLLIEYMYMGDGDKDKDGRTSMRYNTASPRLRDDFQRLCILLGYRANDKQMRERCFKYGCNHDNLYRINVLSRTQAVSKYCADRPNYPGYYIEENYQGMVHCCTVSTGVILIKRDGKMMWCGNSIVPDEDMLKDANGEPFDVIQSSLGIPSRINPIQLAELQLGKIAKHTGVPEVLPDFPKFNIREYTLNKLKEHGLSDTERVYDPVTDMYIDNVGTGYMFQYKLKHMAESKKGSRSTGDYTMEETPLKGGSEGARRFGSMEWGALMGHTGLESEIAKDAKLIRGQMNHEFWQKVRNGETPDKPGIPLVHKKFFAHLQAAGINVEDRGRTVHFFGATDEDIRRLTKNRQVTTASTYDAKDLRPIKGGLFDPNIFGENGDQWGYYDLPEPILNPMMAKSIQAILGWKQSEMQEVLEGAREVNGKVGTEAIMSALDNMDLDKELRDTKALLKSKSTPVSKRSDLAKKYRALYAIKENDKQPNDFFLTRIPILPPRYRAVSIIGNDVGIVSDANFLYKKFIDAVEDFKEAKQVLPQEELLDARKTLYNSIEAVIGLRDPDDPKLQSKKVEGVLAWVTGKSSPKLGSTHRKVFGTTVDIGGRNVISPDNSLALDEVGISEETAWNMYEPFVVRKLRQRGMSMTGAVDAVLNRDKEAFQALEDCLKERPLLINRAPTLHKYSIMACKPKITKGNTLHVSPAICKQFNADFDGDSAADLVKIEVTSEIFEKMLK